MEQGVRITVQCYEEVLRFSASRLQTNLVVSVQSDGGRASGLVTTAGRRTKIEMVATISCRLAFPGT